MPQINISLKQGSPKSELEDAKKHVKDIGGKVLHEFKLVPGFTADMPDDDDIQTLESKLNTEELNVEKDGEVTTQDKDDKEKDS